MEKIARQNLGQDKLLEKLKQYAGRNNVSHKRLGRSLGVSNVTLAQWLNGHRKLRPDECHRIEVFLKLK